MEQDKIKSIVGVIGALLGIYNLLAQKIGWPCLAFANEDITSFVTALWTICFTLYSTWKNCNITDVSKSLQNYMDAYKDKDIYALTASVNDLINRRNMLLNDIKGVNKVNE